MLSKPFLWHYLSILKLQLLDRGRLGMQSDSIPYFTMGAITYYCRYEI